VIRESATASRAKASSIASFDRQLRRRKIPDDYLNGRALDACLNDGMHEAGVLLGLLRRQRPWKASDEGRRNLDRVDHDPLRITWMSVAAVEGQRIASAEKLSISSSPRRPPSIV
jgi:hypothetical protein